MTHIILHGLRTAEYKTKERKFPLWRRLQVERSEKGESKHDEQPAQAGQQRTWKQKRGEQELQPLDTGSQILSSEQVASREKLVGGEQD